MKSSTKGSTTTHSWSDYGAVDNINFETEPIPNWEPVKCQETQYVRLPSVVLQEENFRKGKCKHGTKFYHPEASCISCMLKGSLLDQKVAEPITPMEIDESNSYEIRPDFCAHGTLIDLGAYCTKCCDPPREEDEEQQCYNPILTSEEIKAWTEAWDKEAEELAEHR
jgi:hypothetical protein